MNQKENVVERLMDAISTALDFAESRPRAWLIASAGLAITVGCWWVALTTPATAFSPPKPRFLLMGLVVGVLAGPFLMVAAFLQAVSRHGAEDTWTETGLLFNQGSRVGARQRRRAVFAAALMAVANAFMLFIARYR